MIDIIATALSLAGAYLVSLSLAKQRAFGFATWIISNILWVGYFWHTNQMWPLALFTIYGIFAVKGLITNYKLYNDERLKN